MSLRVFGYGSLLFKPDLPYVACVPARLRGWSRRFWQGSPDHRGTPAAPGRVATLVAAPGEAVVGLVYTVPPDAVGDVLARLDVREAAGFDRWHTPVETEAGPLDALIYRANEANPHFLGPAPLDAMADHVARSHGPSGPNADYVLGVDRVLRELGVEDDHTASLAEAVRARIGGDRG